MPNGRSGGFVIETNDLKRLIEAVTGNAVVGRLTTGSKPHDARVDEIAQVIEKCPHNRIAVEEQDHAFYIIHISNAPDVVGIVILSESPLFVELRRRHAIWMAEHPDWNGWIAF
jgi:hypothetical protein